jgi:hypothetical protein
VHFLLEIHGRLKLVGRATGTAFDLPVSQEVIGGALGLSVPHVNRMRRRKEGMIAADERHIRFTNLRGLQVLAHFQPVRLSRVPASNVTGRELIA